MTPHYDEDFDLIDPDVEQVVTIKLRNTMLHAEEDETFFDTETFEPIDHLGAIILIPKLLCILKFKFFHMDVKNTSIIKCLNVEVNKNVSNYATDNDGVIKKG